MKFRILLFVALIIGGALLVAINQAPETSSIKLDTCVQSTAGDCVRFPIVTGDTLNGDTVTLPEFFAGEYNLVIVPFDREQQESVIDWLPLAEDLQAEFDGLAFYSVGALPDLPAGVRLLISGGMTLVLESDVRDVSILLYLEDQQLFADSLSASSLDETQLYILNQDGDVIWQASGSYNDDLADELRQQVAGLQFEDASMSN